MYQMHFFPVGSMCQPLFVKTSIHQYWLVLGMCHFLSAHLLKENHFYAASMVPLVLLDCTFYCWIWTIDLPLCTCSLLIVLLWSIVGFANDVIDLVLSFSSHVPHPFVSHLLTPLQCLFMVSFVIFYQTLISCLSPCPCPLIHRSYPFSPAASPSSCSFSIQGNKTLQSKSLVNSYYSGTHSNTQHT